MSRNLQIDPWRILATSVEFPIGRLRPAETEILDMMDRVIIRGMGWGKKDTLRNIRDRIPLSPKKLSCHGNKKSPRTYQRAIRYLEQLGLLVYQDTGSDQVRSYSPAWWVVESCDNAQQVWQQATEVISDSDNTRPLCRSNVVPLSPPCRSSVAPPVTNESLLAPHSTEGCNINGATSSRTGTEDGNPIDQKKAL